MYLGEVKVEKENLDDFMRVCKKLEILGLTGESMASFNDDTDLKETARDIVESDDIAKETVHITYRGAFRSHALEVRGLHLQN